MDVNIQMGTLFPGTQTCGIESFLVRCLKLFWHGARVRSNKLEVLIDKITYIRSRRGRNDPLMTHPTLCQIRTAPNLKFLNSFLRNSIRQKFTTLVRDSDRHNRVHVTLLVPVRVVVQCFSS
jgi:hypothetical protein